MTDNPRLGDSFAVKGKKNYSQEKEGNGKPKRNKGKHALSNLDYLCFLVVNARKRMVRLQTNREAEINVADWKK